MVQAGVETSDSTAEAVKPDPRCSSQDHSRRVGATGEDESDTQIPGIETDGFVCTENFRWWFHSP